MTYRKGRVAVDPTGMLDAYLPAHGRTPIVADEAHLLYLEGIEDAEQVLDKPVDLVVMGLRRDIGLAETPQVGRGDRETCVDERTDLIAPYGVRVQEAVDEGNVRTVVLDDNVETQPPRPRVSSLGCSSVLLNPARGHDRRRCAALMLPVNASRDITSASPQPG